MRFRPLPSPILHPSDLRAIRHNARDLADRIRKLAEEVRAGRHDEPGVYRSIVERESADLNYADALLEAASALEGAADDAEHAGRIHARDIAAADVKDADLAEEAEYEQQKEAA